VIETRLLQQFIAVAEELHFHRAAIRLHMAQPPLSQAINRLEEKLGFVLLVRDKREVRLTAAGRAFLQGAYQTLQALNQGTEYAREVSRGLAGKLTVTTLSIVGYGSLLSTFRQFKATFPKAQLVIKEMPSLHQAQAIAAGEADIAFMRTLPIASSFLTSRLLLTEDILLALPIDHPRGVDKDVDLRDFADDDFVFTPQTLGSGYHQQLIALCEAAGFYPRVVQEAAQLHTLIGLVAGGFGVALVPETVAQSVRHDSVTYRKIRPLSPTIDTSLGLYATWDMRNDSPLLGRFASMLDFSETSAS
jgi:DNA-binding transcriptional LysR family regulator